MLYNESGREKNTLLVGVGDLSIPSIETSFPDESKSHESNQHTKPVSTRMSRYGGQNESSLVIPGDKLDIHGSNRMYCSKQSAIVKILIRRFMRCILSVVVAAFHRPSLLVQKWA